VTLNRRIFITGLGAGSAGLMAGFADFDRGFMLSRALGAEDELHKAGPLGEIVIGSKDAKVTLIEYASLTCSHCRAFHMNTYPKLKKKYIDTGKVKMYFREFPLNPPDQVGYMLARCAGDAKYVALVDLLFKRQPQWARPKVWVDELFNLSKFAGFTKDKFDACVKNVEIAKGLQAVQAKGQKFRVNSTPTFFLNGELIAGDPGFDAFDKKISALLK
jgi:protein-disulfide isomerase